MQKGPEVGAQQRLRTAALQRPSPLASSPGFNGLSEVWRERALQILRKDHPIFRQDVAEANRGLRRARISIVEREQKFHGPWVASHRLVGQPKHHRLRGRGFGASCRFRSRRSFAEGYPAGPRRRFGCLLGDPWGWLCCPRRTASPSAVARSRRRSPRTSGLPIGHGRSPKLRAQPPCAFSSSPDGRANRAPIGPPALPGMTLNVPSAPARGAAISSKPRPSPASVASSFVDFATA